MRHRKVDGQGWNRPRCRERRERTQSKYYSRPDLYRASGSPQRAAAIAICAYGVDGLSGHWVLTVIKKERDEDYHLVAADAGNANVTMIVESPEPRCAIASAFADNIGFVRNQLDQKFGDFRRLEPKLPVTVTGVAFFDPIHGQEGVARNGIELHPILNITFQ